MIAPVSGSSLLPRILAAVVLVPTALLAVWEGSWALAIFVSAAAVAMAREWCRIVHREDMGWRFAIHVLAIVASQSLVVFGYANWGLSGILVAALAGSAAAQAQGERAIWVMLGVLAIAVPCFAFVWLRQDPLNGFDTLVWLLCVVWATDSAAYVAGSYLGGPKLAPAISPNKTWAGAVAGLAAAALVGILLPQLAGMVATWQFVGASLALSVLTQCGDLAESFLKRNFGVKDASDLIPGHGGALDRLDGLIFATLGLAAYVQYAGHSPVAWIAP